MLRPRIRSDEKHAVREPDEKNRRDRNITLPNLRGILAITWGDCSKSQRSDSSSPCEHSQSALTLQGWSLRPGTDHFLNSHHTILFFSFAFGGGELMMVARVRSRKGGRDRNCRFLCPRMMQLDQFCVDRECSDLLHDRARRNHVGVVHDASNDYVVFNKLSL